MKRTTALRRAARAARTLGRSIGRYRNWPEITRAVLAGDRPRRLLLRNGLQIEAPADSTALQIVGEVFAQRLYLPAPLTLDPHDVVVDVGANIGIFTLFAALRTSGAIHAFEPFPGNAEYLERNLRQNGFGRVVVHRAAVNDVAGSARLYLSEIGGGHLLFDHNNQGSLDDWVDVTAITLEQILEEERLERIDFLKLDCEGAEGAILETTPRSCLRRVRQIAMEFHDNVSRLDHSTMEALLLEAGFRTQLRWNGRSPFGYLYGWQPR